MTIPYRVFECGLQKRYHSLICHYKGRFLQAIFHTSMSISIHVMMMVEAALLRRRREFLFLKKKTSCYQTAPIFLMTLHSFLPSYISHLTHFSIHTKPLHWCCAADLLRRRRHILRFEITESSKLGTRIYLATLPSFSLARYLLGTYTFRSDMRLVEQNFVVLQEQNFAF